ncbi:hypothetical protein J0910_00010 [Nocardiopsis sp. CNT-189]|uniref:hypothetical protein n=1 Tax=Nocardiopsis oceanisediminis TaxID=2816862 RepID=UPI003B2A6B9B
MQLNAFLPLGQHHLLDPGLQLPFRLTSRQPQEGVLRGPELVRRVDDQLLFPHEQRREFERFEDAALAVLPGHDQPHLVGRPLPVSPLPSPSVSTSFCHGSSTSPHEAAMSIASAPALLGAGGATLIRGT